MSNYTLKVKNTSGANKRIAIFQTYPDMEDGLPLVWLTQTVNNHNSNTYTWSIKWSLDWGTTPQPLQDGVKWSSSGSPQPMDPTAVGGNNKMGVTFENSQFETIPAYHDPKVPSGSMVVATDTTFTVSDAAKMSLAVGMNDIPAFAMQGEPNGIYKFDTHPTYWIAVIDSEQGVAVSGDFLSNATQFQFAEGATELSYVLTDTLQFKPA